MTKLPLHTPDLTTKNYTALSTLFSNAVTETIDGNGNVVRAIDADVLAQEINTHVVSGKEERYQFTWPDKKKTVLMANSPIAVTLRPCREESINFDNTENLYIEGDNLDVLKLLRETYLNRVKMIYIDPPYNTGNDFIYEDEFAENASEFLVRDNQYDEDGNRMVRNLDSNGRFHTDWLNMIYSRLRIARDLLTDDGVVFISIDDNEVDNLKKICNEIFGESNFFACVSWHKNYASANDAKAFSNVLDYILVYKKSLAFERNLLPRTDKQNSLYKYDNNDGRGRWRPDNLSVKSYSANYDYPIVNPKTSVTYNPPKGRCWLTNKDTIQRWIQETRVFFGKDGEGAPQLKRYLNEVQQGVVPTTYWSYEDCGHNDESRKEIKELFDSPPFDTPKPTRLLQQIITIACKSSDIILDFFSGSATTAHAVMQLNAEDGGKRKFIMIQLPEVCADDSEAAKAGYKNICEIGKERIRRAGKKIVNESPLDRAELDIGFRVLKLDSSNMKDVYYTPQDTVSEVGALAIDLDGFVDNIKADRTAEDLLFQVMLDLGISLSSKIEKREIGGRIVYFVDNNKLLACFDRVTDEIVTEIAKNKPYYAVFRDSSFYNDATLVNFEQIFKTYSPTTIRKVL
jgi:adenine-specific DNA-methyltransferase